MNKSKIAVLTLAALAVMSSGVQAAVKLTALQIISTDAAGKIQGVGAHRFKTTNHGGQPAIFVVQGEDINGPIMNGPTTKENGIEIPLSNGTHTFTMYAEKSNSYSWTNYTINLHFDLANSAQISALVPLNVNSTQFFPPFTANGEFTEDLTAHSVKAANSLSYKSGQTTVKLVGFHFSTQSLYNKDRVSPFEAKSNKNLDYVGQITLEVTAPPEIAPGGVVNAASFAGKMAPGSLFSVFGTSLAQATVSAQGMTWPTTLGGASVTVGGRPAPIYFVSPGQINAQVPFEVQDAPSVPVIVTVNGVSSVAANAAIVQAAPGIFQFGEKRAVVQNQDYSVNNTDNGAEAGSYIIAYATGCGRLDNPVASGSPAPVEPLSRPLGNVTATINGIPTEVVFGGLSPNFIGLMQVNMRVPNVPAGNYPLVISVNGEKSNAATITVK